MSRGSKPGERRGGRQKGTPNKINSDIKGMILKALNDKGGVEYLKQQADLNPVAFMSLVAKVLPTTLAGDPDNPVVVENRAVIDRPERESREQYIARRNAETAAQLAAKAEDRVH